jgi:glycosyltransferase involved in cell wall biosynthesis
MTSNPKVSIVIPVYNGSNYLKEAIDSALEQTCKDFEVIVVDDGSNDGGQTAEIAKSYGDRIRYFYKENGGVASALNFGIKEMKGEWFAWLSHDDLFSPNRIEEDLILIEKNPEAKVVFCNIKIIDGKGEIIEDVHYPIQKVTNCYEALMYVDMCAATIHKSCFEKIGLFNEAQKTTQDVDMTFRLASIVPFYLNNNSISYKREHLNRGTYTLSERHQKNLQDFCDFLHEFPITQFFPDLSDKEEDVKKAWLALEKLYACFGATHYAEECHKLAIMSHRNIFIRFINMLKFRINKLNHRLNKKFITLISPFYKRPNE